MTWTEAARCLPAEGEEVETKIDDSRGVRNEQRMTYRNRLWWINVGEPGEMYVYYWPTHWRVVRDR